MARWALLAVFALVSLSAAAPLAHALEVQQVTEGVYALVGEKAQRSPENLANNATFGVVVTGEGVVLIDPGGSWKGAEAIHAAIGEITDQPVKVVIDSGGQDHRWLGNSYWKARGARIIASEAAVADQQARASMQFSMLHELLGEALQGTEAVSAEETFAESHSFELGGVAFEIHHVGPAHTPGDSFVWLPRQRTVFTGDIVYVERLLGVDLTDPELGQRDDVAAWAHPTWELLGSGLFTDAFVARLGATTDTRTTARATSRS